MNPYSNLFLGQLAHKEIESKVAHLNHHNSLSAQDSGNNDLNNLLNRKAVSQNRRKRGGIVGWASSKVLNLIPNFLKQLFPAAR